MKQTFKMVFGVVLFSLMSLTGFAQNAVERTAITGKVVDKDGLGVIGLNVIEKGTKHAVLTDIDGSYKIQVPKGAVLQFSYIGMKTVEKPVGASTTINITMLDDTSTLNEVVVVGYGSQKKEHLTGAIATINPDELTRLPVTNLAESLRGQIPGLSVGGNGSRRPGEAADLTIRQTFGFATNAVSSLPLVVIDDMVQIDPVTGMPTLDTFNRLDPSEIESITVLKDGSAAIYGARAAQGAIVVKTKRGKAGKTKFSYSSQFSLSDAISHGKTMSAYESGIYSNRIVQALNVKDDPATNSKFYSPADLEEMKTLDYNWLDKAWRAAEQQKHTINVSGGNEEATYFAGITYLTQGANLGKQDFKKWNFRTGVNAKISKDLDMSLSVSGNSGDIEKSFTKSSSGIKNGFASAVTNAEQADYGLLLHMPKFIPITTTVNGEEYYMSPFPRADQVLGGNQNTNSSIAGWNYFANLDSGSKQISSDFMYNVNGSLSYRVPFIKGLSLRGSYAISQTHSNTEQVALPFTLARIKNFNLAGRHLASGIAPDTSNDGYSIADNNKQTRVVYDNNNSKSVQTNFFVNYKRTFGDHDVDGMFSIERSENEYNGTRLYYENTGKDYLGTYASAGTLTTNSTSAKGEGGTLSYLGRLNYSYKSKYLLQLLFRQDASTKFAPENYWGTFPSAQVGWIVSKEDWFERALPGVDFLKLRYSIGKTGKDNVASWKWSTYYDIITDKGFQFGDNGGSLGSSLATRANPNRNVGWDTTIKQNYGIDFNVLNNRLQITADYYYDKTTDMLTPMAGTVDVPISVGGAFAEQNYAAVNGWGSEFSVKWNDNVRNFNYNVGVNFGFSNNEVKKYPEQAIKHPSFNVTQAGSSLFFPNWGFKTWNETSTGDGILRTDEDVQNYKNYLTANAAAAGTGAPSFFDKSLDEIQKGMLAYQDLGGDYDGDTRTQKGPDGKISKNLDYAKIGKSTRSYGFTTNLGAKYKGVFVQSQIATSWGGSASIDVVPQFTGSTDGFYSRESFWTDMYGYDNLNGKYPNLKHRDYLSSPSDFWQVNPFRCTVRNLTVGFDIPKEVLSQLKISNASLSFTGNNLWDLYNPYPDKYRNMYDSSSAGYPTLRTWTVNLNITF